MENLVFRIDLLALLGLLLLTLLMFWGWKLSQNYLPPQLLFSSLQYTKNNSKSWWVWGAKLPFNLLCIAWACFALAFLDPHFEIPRSQASDFPTEGIAIYLVLDQSGSMSSKVTIGRAQIPKIDLLKQVTSQFVEGDPNVGLTGRPRDLIGLVSFARQANVLVPLTLDHRAILNKLKQLRPVQRDEDDGTAIGYAIFKTVNLIVATKHYAENVKGSHAPAYDIKTAIIILVTDGFQSPNPLDQENQYRSMSLEQAGEFAKKNGVRVYVANVEPAFATSEFAPFRRVMEQMAESTGGKFYLMAGQSLDQIYGDIDRLEKSRLPGLRTGPVQYERLFSFYPWLIEIGMILLITALFLKTVLFRSVP